MDEKNTDTNKIHDYISVDEQNLVHNYIDLYNIMITGKNSSNFLRDFPVLGNYSKPVKRMTRELVGRDRQLLQLRAGLQRPELCNVLLLGEAGSGKALKNGTSIPVADSRGYVNIENITIGDYVFDENGNPAKVLGVYPQGKKHAYNVLFSDGRSIICNDNHLWTVSDDCSGNVYKTVSLRDIIDAYNADRNIRFYTPLSKAVDRKPVDLPVPPYIFGSFLCNYCISDSKMISEIDIILKQRCIPKIYLMGSISQRMDLLRGFMDTNGEIDEKTGYFHCVFSSENKSIVSDLQELVRSLGAKIYVSDNKENLSVIIYGNDMSSTLEITSVTDLGTEYDMTCIYVDSASHLFQAGREHIVTHNTALVQGAMAQDVDRLYLEIDLARMIADLKDNNEMAAKIKILFDETAMFVKLFGIEIVLFIDEFHQIITLSSAAVEALKPMLADSGTRGIRVIVATTFGEFREYVSKNQALIERLQRIELVPPDTNVTVQILKGYAKVYNVADQIEGDYLYRQIVELTNRYVPANSQPRKSILLLDMMVGWYRMNPKRYPMDIKLLHKVIEDSEGIKLDVAVDAPSFKKKLDARVFSQGMATYAVASRLQICAADLNDKTKPMASFIFTGSTGVGKTELTKAMAEELFGDDSDHLIRFDMTEFANSDSIERFRKELTTKVWEHPYSVVLLDEIEKACAEVTRLLLGVLDDGRLVDQNSRVVSFLNCYIVLTTNAAAEVYKSIGAYDNIKSGLTQEEQDALMIKTFDKNMKLIRRAIVNGQGANKFPPELLGRVDEICPFMPLSEETQEKILRSQMTKFAAEVMSKHQVRIDYDTSRIIKYILFDKLDTESNSGGARIVKTKFQNEVVKEVARVINLGDYTHLVVEVAGKMAAEDQNKLESDAHITAIPLVNGIRIENI